jgi:N-methylhydantoinase A
VYARGDLAPGMRFDGPAIIEQSDTTTVVEPGMDVVVDLKGNLLVKVK